MTAGRAGSADGFTLLEMLVAITLLSFLSLVLVTSLRIGTHIWGKADNTSLGENAVRTAQRVLDRDLGRLYPLFVAPSATDGFVDFDGTPSRLTFLSTAGQESGLIKRITVSAAPDGSDLSLHYSSALELAPSVILSSGPLLRHLASLRFAYFGADDRAHEPGWRSTWQHMRSAPLLIRISVVTKGTEYGTWPELVVRPRIDADVSCKFDLLAKFCLGR
jgi:general secretion pathway protein J